MIISFPIGTLQSPHRLSTLTLTSQSQLINSMTSQINTIATQRILPCAHVHRGWTPFYFMYNPNCSTTFTWCTINAPVAFDWCNVGDDAPAAFVWCTNHFVHKVEVSYIGLKGAHPLKWRHNGHDCVSNHQPYDCLLNRLFRRRSKKTSKLRHWPLCGEFTGDRWISRTNGQYRGKCFHLMTSSCHCDVNGTQIVSKSTDRHLNTELFLRVQGLNRGCVTLLTSG